MTEAAGLGDEGDGQTGPGRTDSGPGSRQLVRQPVSGRATGSGGAREDGQHHGQSTPDANAQSGVPGTEEYRKILAWLAMATLNGKVSPKVSAVVGTHIKTLIDSDPSTRVPRHSSAATNGSKHSDGTGGTQPELSEQAIDTLLEVVLSCDPSALHILQPFLSPGHMERVRTFYGRPS